MAKKPSFTTAGYGRNSIYLKYILKVGYGENFVSVYHTYYYGRKNKFYGSRIWWIFFVRSITDTLRYYGGNTAL